MAPASPTTRPGPDVPAAVIYPLAALAEIAGCFAVWAWWRSGASALWLLPGVASLAAFGWLLAQVEVGLAGRAFAAEAARKLGPIDILFNNAGINIRKPFEAYTEDEFDRIIAVHLKGMFFMAQAVYPAMVARGQGCIINVASQRGLKGAVNSAPYSAAKAAIMGFTRALAWEATPKGIRVNAIAPGPVVTDLTATMTPQDRQAFIDALPVGRFGRPEEIAATALLLAGPDGGFYVGATLSPNGGDVMY